MEQDDYLTAIASPSTVNRTAQYPFASLSVGNYFTVFDHFQHARVAASEYARKYGVVFSCRKQEDGSMRVYRVESSQDQIDKRGRHGKRRIPSTIKQPTKQEFMGWLASLAPATLYKMPATYTQSFLAMQAWVELFALKNNVAITSALQSDGTLLIARS